MSFIFYTCDQHFGHENIIKHCNRPFRSAEEMDLEMIHRWNERVSSEDEVYIVGDLIFRAPKPPSKYLEALNGRKHLLIGNHDGKWLKQVDVGRYFISVNMVLTIMDRNFQVELSHKPNLEFIAYTKDSYHVYGHIHNNTHDDYWLDLKVMTHALNAGVEINHYTPCTLEELIENNNAFKKMLDEKQDISEL